MNDNLDKVSKLTTNLFEKRLLKAAFYNLRNEDNKLRFNNFSYSLRELLRHILSSHSPDEEVLSSSWYKNEIIDKENGITRGQRIKYAIQGGLPDSYIMDSLGIDIKQDKKQIIKTIGELSKYTHINNDTFDISSPKVENRVTSVCDTFALFFELIEESRKKIIVEMENRIEEALFQSVISETIEEIDELSTHHRIKDLIILDVSIVGITSCDIVFEAYGEIVAEQQFGSDSDVKKDNGFIQNNDFPFSSKIIYKIESLANSNHKIKVQSLTVDTELDISDEELEYLIDKYLEENDLLN